MAKVANEANLFVFIFPVNNRFQRMICNSRFWFDFGD